MARDGRPAQRLGLLYQPRKSEARHLAAATAQQLQALGVEVWTESSWEEDRIAARLPGTDLVLTFGGDGTVIRAARLTAPLGVPVASINLGKLGFLTEIEAADLADVLPRLLAGDFWVETRILLAAAHQRNGQQLGTHLAVNEVHIGRGRINRILRIHLWIQGEYVTSYAADGLIIATPTGSTGSNLANGGPVLPPEMEAMVIMPVLPFVSFPNPLVCPTTDLSLTVRVDTDHEAVLSIDGQSTILLEDRDHVEVTAAPQPCLLARLGNRHKFYRVLVPRLQRKPILPPQPETPTLSTPLVAPSPSGGARA